MAVTEEKIKSRMENGKTSGPDEPMCAFLENLYYEQMGYGLEERAMQDAGYTEAVRIMTTAARALEQPGPEADLCALTDALITAANNCSAEYGRVAYVQGFVDAVCRLQEEKSDELRR